MGIIYHTNLVIDRDPGSSPAPAENQGFAGIPAPAKIVKNCRDLAGISAEFASLFCLLFQYFLRFYSFFELNKTIFRLSLLKNWILVIMTTNSKSN